MIRMIKRWAFWPVLALVCMTLCSMALNPGHGSLTGVWIGLGVSVVLAVLIDRRRRRA
jgi:hypothetical protein